jgi:hypothetical protein
MSSRTHADDVTILTVPQGEGESPTSFLSRVAAANGTFARRFCQALGLDFQKLVDGCSHALGHLAALTGASREELVRQAIVKVDEQTFTWRGETFGRSILRRQRVMVCPACLQEDLAAESRRRPYLSAFGRTL